MCVCAEKTGPLIVLKDALFHSFGKVDNSLFLVVRYNISFIFRLLDVIFTVFRAFI